MEDRFKFRVWDSKEKQYLDKDNTNFVLEQQSGKIVALGGITFYPEGGMVVQQCTGLKDKNGKLIYEGDIIKYPNPSTKAVSIIFEVYKGAENISSRCGFYEKLQYDNAGISKGGHWYLCEIIGNFYENPELINKQ